MKELLTVAMFIALLALCNVNSQRVYKVGNRKEDESSDVQGLPLTTIFFATESNPQFCALLKTALLNEQNIPDKEFAKGIAYLIEHKVLDVQESGDELYIPKWFKFTTAWWSSGQITDTTYAHAIQYLLNEKFMIIPFDQESDDSITEDFL